MTYELAKKLKDAGFPQEDFKVHSAEHPAVKKGSILEGQSGTPTLSELIEACGAPFALTWKGVEWLALGLGADGQGSTPEEAVANLWLALNQKES